MSKYLEEFKDIYTGFMERSHSLIVGGYWHLKENRLSFDKKAEDFRHVQNATEAVVDALKLFIEGAEGERDKPGIQPYVNEILNTVNIHLGRIDKYYTKNQPKGFKKNEHKKKEEIFQQQVFKGEREIKTSLNKLNLDNTFKSISVEFYDKRIATLPMKDILYELDHSIRKKIDSLVIDWDLIMENGLLINMDPKKVPEYNPEKHFWDQEQEVLQFWVSEYNKIKHGIDIDGYFMSPWMYFHLNYFKTPIKNQGNKIMNPPLRDNEWYIDEIKKYARKKALELKPSAIMIYGTRRFAKTTSEASHTHHGIIIYPTEAGTVSSSNDEDLNSFTDKLHKSLSYVHPAFQVNLLSGKSLDKKVEIGLKSKSGARTYLMFTLNIINTDGGSKKGSQKTAGGNPRIFVADEIGKGSFIKAHNAAVPSFESDDGWVCDPIYTGTGGDEDLSEDAVKVLSDPTQYDFIEMDWDILEKGIPKEHITWSRRKFGWFIPAQMSTKTGFKKIKTNLADFLGVKSEELSKIDFYQTDWAHNNEVVRERRAKRKGAQLQQEIVFRPIDPEECFMSAKNNPFPAQRAKTNRERIIAQGNDKVGIARAVELFRDTKDPTKIKHHFSNKEIAKWPHRGGFIDSPVLLFDSLPEVTPPKWRFVAGFDDYKHDESNGDSIGAFYIFDRLYRRVVLSIATRPDPHGALHQQIHMALDAYNAMCFPENEDMDIKKYFDKLGLSYKYLAEGFDVTKKLNFSNTGNRKYGWQPGKFTTPFVIGLVIDYCKQEIEIKNEKGEVIDIKLGIDLIDDIDLLEEIVKYKEDGNYDRIIAFGSALFFDHYCTITYKVPRAIPTVSEQESRWKGKDLPKPARNKYFSKTRRRLL